MQIVINCNGFLSTQSGGMAGGFTEPKYGHTETRKVKQPNINQRTLPTIP